MTKQRDDEPNEKLAVCIALGIPFGLLFGIIFGMIFLHNIGMGIAVGMPLGVILGLVFGTYTTKRHYQPSCYRDFLAANSSEVRPSEGC